MDLPEHRQREYKKISSNKKATFNFEIISKIEAGIELVGTEVKSLRNGKCSLQESYCRFKSKNSDELYIVNMFIPHFEQGNQFNHEEKRDRKLLTHRHQASKWHSQMEEKSYTMVPTEIYFSGHLVKVEIALVKPKKVYNKKESIKSRDVDRDTKRALKNLR